MNDVEKKKGHPVLATITTTAVVGTAAYMGYSYYIFQDAFETDSTKYKLDSSIQLQFAQMQQRNDSWYAESVRDDCYLESFDGLRLHAIKITNHPKSHKWVIFVHGFKAYSLSNMDYFYPFDQKDFNILTIDQRSCGLSEGKYNGLGWSEHYDLISWINYLVNLDHEAQIVLYGVSMGGTTVMNAIGDYLPKNVCCAIEDGGFCGAKEIIADRIHKQTNLAGEFFLRGIDVYVKHILHFSLYEASTLQQLSQSVTPILFYHGDNDSIVPSEMVNDCYYACRSEKELFTFSQAEYAVSYKNENYFPNLFSFIEKHMN